MRAAAAQRRGVAAPRVPCSSGQQGIRTTLEKVGGATSSQSLGTGTLTDYVKVRTVGRGSFGEAVLVQHRVTGRECVLKRVRVEAPAGEGPTAAAENALREVQVLRRLQHPHIVEFLGAFADTRDTTGGTLCLLMAYCEGGDLQQRLMTVRQEGQHLSEQLALRWFDQLCSAVAYVHSRQVLHRDLKPSNIFIAGSGDEETVAVGDFGVSRPLAHALELVTTMVGTPCYLSPEVCRGRPYSYKSDVWSLGCVLFEMIALRPPFGQAANLEALVAQIVKAEYVVSEGLAEEYPEAIRCARAMLRTDPERRPTAQALISRPKLYPSNSIRREASVEGSKTSAGRMADPPALSPPRHANASERLAQACRAGLSQAHSPPRNPNTSVAVAVAVNAAAAANAAVAAAHRAQEGRGRAPQDRAQNGRTKLAHRILQAEAEQDNVLQAWNDCDPAQLGAPVNRGRNSPGVAAPHHGRGVTRQVSGNIGAIRRQTSREKVGSVTANHPACIRRGRQNGNSPASPGAAKRGLSQPVHRQQSDGIRVADERSRHPLVYRRRSDGRPRSPHAPEDNPGLRHPQGHSSPQVVVAVSGKQRSHGSSAIVSPPFSSKPMSPRVTTAPTGMEPPTSCRFSPPSQDPKDPKLRRRREDRAEKSQAQGVHCQATLRHQRTGSGTGSALPSNAPPPGSNTGATHNEAIGEESVCLQDIQAVPSPPPSSQQPASPGPPGARTPLTRSPTGSMGLTSSMIRSNSLPRNSGNFANASPRGSLSCLTLSPEGDLLRTGVATDVSTTMGSRSPGSTLTPHLSARVATRVINSNLRVSVGSPRDQLMQDAQADVVEEGYDDASAQNVSIGDRIEGIRACLEARMGTERFQKLYRSLSLDSGSLVGVAASNYPEGNDAVRSESFLGASPMQAWPMPTTMGLTAVLREVFNDAEGCGSDVDALAPLVAKLVECEHRYFS